jgi:hypothetical protein
VGETVRTGAQFAAEVTDHGDDVLAEPMRKPLGPAAAVLKTRQSLLAEAPPPFGDSRSGEAEPAGDLSLREPLLKELDESEPSGWSELGVRM